MSSLSVRELLDLERQIYQESIDRVRTQQTQLRNGELEEFVRRRRPFEDAKERELQAARAQRELSRQDAASLLAFDLQQADDVFNANRAQLKRQLLERTRRRRTLLQKRLRGGRERKENVVEKVGEKTLEQQLSRAQRNTRKAFNLRHLRHGVLPTPQRIVRQVLQECEILQRNREREEAARMAEEEGAPPKVRVEVKGNELLVQEQTFAVGDAVVLHSQLTEEDFHGFVSTVSPQEVHLVLVCGSHVRVTLARLRSGQCSLRKHSEKARVLEPRDDGQNYRANLSAPSLEGLLRDPPDVRRRAIAAMNRRKRKTTVDIRRGF